MVYEVWFVETGLTAYWSEDQCKEAFGPNEWPEYLAGYLPNVIVVEVS